MPAVHGSDPPKAILKGGPVGQDTCGRHGTSFDGLHDSRIAGFIRPQVICMDNEPLQRAFTPRAQMKRFLNRYLPSPASLKFERPDERSAKK